MTKKKNKIMKMKNTKAASVWEEMNRKCKLALMEMKTIHLNLTVTTSYK